MPQFGFSATDKLGNNVEGTIFSSDEATAADQVRQMGYSPLRIGGASHTTTDEPTQMLPMFTVPATAAAPLVPLDIAPEEDALPERVEPWQRGGTVAQTAATAAPTLTMNAYGNVVPTQMPPQARNTPPVAGSYTPRSETGAGRDMAIPYGTGYTPKRSFGRKFAETLVYPIFAGVTFKSLPPFFRSFATLINAGIPLYQALGSLEAATSNAKLKEVARAGQRQVEAGGHFSDVMAAYPWVFQPVQIELVRAAEQGGMLDQALLQIADYVEHELEIRRMISRETLQPKITLTIAFLILGRPGFSGAMPAVSALVVGTMGKMAYTMADYLKDTFGFALTLLVPLLILTALFRLVLFNISGIREAYDSFKMSVPVVGNIVKMFALSRFTRTFAALYRGGFAMGSCLRIAGDGCGNAVLRRAAYRAVPYAEQGGLVSDAMQSVMPPIALNMMRTGETTGNMDTMLDKVAEYYESEGKLKSNQGAKILGVVVFLVVAYFVATAIIGFYTGGSYGGAVEKELRQDP